MAKSPRRKAAGKSQKAAARGNTVRKPATRARSKAQKKTGQGRRVGQVSATSRARRRKSETGEVTASRVARGARGGENSRHLRLIAESERLIRLIDELGNNRVAELLSVSRSQPSRWRSGKEGIGPENQRKLIDLDYVLGRLGQLYPSRQCEIWLTSHNAHLGGRPIDVLHIRGAAPVIEAIDAEAQGAFA
jgi:hypothetical protein